jgi:DHA1 family tetracycline resistance protein-like MFS transporter
VLSSVTSLTAIVGPLIGTFVYASTKATMIGAVWICGAIIYLLMVPLVVARWRITKAVPT